MSAAKVRVVAGLGRCRGLRRLVHTNMFVFVQIRLANVSRSANCASEVERAEVAP